MIKYFFCLFLFFINFASASDRSILIVCHNALKGELAFAERVKAAAERIHWKADIYKLTVKKNKIKKKYDIVVNLTPNNINVPKSKKYLAIFHPEHHFFDQNGYLKKVYQNYDGYLLTYDPAISSDPKTFVNKKKYPYMKWYPTAQFICYQVVNPNYLFYIPSCWGDRESSTNMREFQSLLDLKLYTHFYGTRILKKKFPHSYRKMIPYDAKSLISTITSDGVSLVIHSSNHNEVGLPSGRIFEAAAASSVIICDKNAFVKENFGDSVLYIDSSQGGSEIFAQVDKHMKWIKTHKAEALEKAKRAHKIFVQKFLLEDQLIRLGEFHDQIVKQKN